MKQQNKLMYDSKCRPLQQNKCKSTVQLVNYYAIHLAHTSHY